MSQRQRTWTADQQKVLDQVEVGLKYAISEARAKLETIGITREQGSFCFRCTCEGFTAKSPEDLNIGGGDHPVNPCLRLVCGHPFTSHNVV